MGEGATKGRVCLKGGKYGLMAFGARAKLQNQAIAWLRKRCRSRVGGKVVRFPRFWRSSGECRLKALERENRELRQANEILRKASAYFAQAELDRPFKR